MMTRVQFLLILVAALQVSVSQAFQNHPLPFTTSARTPTGVSTMNHISTSLCSEPDNTKELSQEDKLSRLGYRSDEIQPKRSEEPIKVQVNEIPNIDATTLTAVGFGLIAFNFFVLANLGDGGIAGTVATIINMLKE